MSTGSSRDAAVTAVTGQIIEIVAKLFHTVLFCRLEADYQMPYYDAVTSDPSVEQMKEVVCDKRIRPQLPEEWETFEV